MRLEDIYRAHVDFVWRVLRRQGVSPADMSDAIQDVFLTVHRSLARFEGRSSLRTWLFTICSSAARDRRQRAHRRHEVAPLDAIGEVVDLRASADARAEHNVRLLLLESALDEMDAPLSEVFVLFEIEDLTGQEISEALSLPLGTVYSRLHLAREAFRRALIRIENGRGAPARRAGERA